MIRTSADYRESLRDGREVWIDGERVDDVVSHPAFRPIVELRGRIYDLAHDPAHAAELTYLDPRSGELEGIMAKLPRTREDWRAKRRAVDLVMDVAGGPVARIGDETVGEMWSLHDARALLDAIDPTYSENIRRHIDRVVHADRFHVSANTDPRGNRTRPIQEQDPDLLLRVVRETDRGIVVRGAKFETAAAYADQAFVKPSIANWGDAEQSEYAVGFIVPMGARGLRHLCRSPLGPGRSVDDAPLSARLDEIDTLLVFDDVEIPWEDVLFYRHTAAAALIRSTLHRYSAFPFVQRTLRLADLMIGAAVLSVRQTGLDQNQSVQEKLAMLAAYREGIDAFLTAAIDRAQLSPGGLSMPNQSLLYAARVHATSQLPEMMQIARELCGGQIALTPSAASFAEPEIGPWLQKYYAIGEAWSADDRRRLLAFARDLLDSDYAGHRLAFQLFAQSPPFANLAAVFRTFDWDRTAAMVADAAGLTRPSGTGTRAGQSGNGG